MPQVATTTLVEVEQEGDVLRLADGRRLQVSPDDATATSIWLPGAHLTLRDGKARSAFNLAVTNEETGQTIAAKLHA